LPYFDVRVTDKPFVENDVNLMRQILQRDRKLMREILI